MSVRSAARALSGLSAAVAFAVAPAAPAQADPDPSGAVSPTAASGADASAWLPSWLRSDRLDALIESGSCLVQAQPPQLARHDGGTAVHYAVRVHCGREVPYRLRLTLTDVYQDSADRGVVEHPGVAPVERQGPGGSFTLDGYSRPCVTDRPSEWKLEVHNDANGGQDNNVLATTLDCRV